MSSEAAEAAAAGIAAARAALDAVDELGPPPRSPQGDDGAGLNHLSEWKRYLDEARKALRKSV